MKKQERTHKGALIGRGRIAEVFSWGDNQALKLFYSGRPQSSIEQEARIGRLVYETGLTAPAVGEVIEVEGRQGIIYERVNGPSMLTQMSAKPWKLIQYARTFAELHTAMHKQVITNLPSQRQGLKQSIQSVTALTNRQKNAIIDVLDELPEEEVLCHGDFHPDNIIMSAHGAIIIDWTTATQGNALADVARTSLLLQLGELPPETPTITRSLVKMGRRLFHKVYLWRYFKLRSDSRQQLAAWQLPIVAARLSDGIAEEQDRLLTLINASLSV